MNNQAFTILEYPQLLGLLRRNAQTESGKRRVDRLVPISTIAELRQELTLLTECISLRNRGLNWAFSEFADPAEILALLRIEGAALSPLPMLEIARLCEQALTVRATVLAERADVPTLWKLVENLPRDLNTVVARVSSKILPSGELDDRSSPELARIRHEITTLRGRITRSLESLMRKSAEAIQDELVTIRNDRFVIPVKADHRARVKGVAHGYSASGATAFVEPLETIDANNELQGMHEAEAREIARILHSLTDELRGQLPGIELAAAAVAELDFINAKAIFHQKFDCVIPKVTDAPPNSSGDLELSDARHPLLEENLRSSGGKVVPVSFALDVDHNAMVISGANAGGKTVVLKTTGLLSLMALSGMSVPASSATFPFYSSVLADIGDHQSLASNLSTFTSHVANIARMIELCERPALVLLDEVGTGTDPEEGSALGVAVVDYFRNTCNAHVITTTHYSGLKMYAGNEPGVVNASVEFDQKTLQPTYRLLVGLAGASSGLEIARRFGVPGRIITSASSLVQDSSRQATEYLRRIKREAEEATELREALEEERAAVAEKFAFLEKDAAKRERGRQTDYEQIVQHALQDVERKSRELLARIEDRSERLKVEREAQRNIATLKREMQQAARAPSSALPAAVDKEIRIVRDGKVVTREFEAAPSEPSYIEAPARPIVIGDKVRLRSFGSVGTVEQIKDGEAEVRVKALRFREKLEDLDLVAAQPVAKSEKGKLEKLKESAVHVQLRGDQRLESELNVIGQTTDEAVDSVDKFLDEASLASLSQVRIVHGHGTGALRRAIAELLRGHPHVSRFIAAPQDQGGSGATLVELKS
ncbi:MAG TPA: Smr/MutS family protein [Pyrinomonadaceae bacterium]|nr:Smr/MutS family protein [Pyrinomonadaceae bacterium]